jgi:hypothetical protein
MIKLEQEKRNSTLNKGNGREGRNLKINDNEVEEIQMEEQMLSG